MRAEKVAHGLEDVLTEGLAVIFCGINPGLTAAAKGHHFAGRSNRFWHTLHLAGFTEVQLRPEDDRALLTYRCGLTAVVERPTASAAQLRVEEFTAAAARFESKIARHAPRFVAFLGKAAYAALTRQRCIAWGLQAQRFGNAAVWVLPNPSGRNLAFSQEQLVEAYRGLRAAVEA